jgi:pyrimidine operon attenuation protein/uracil phosphoribosyltransferase
MATILYYAQDGKKRKALATEDGAVRLALHAICLQRDDTLAESESAKSESAAMMLEQIDSTRVVVVDYGPKSSRPIRLFYRDPRVVAEACGFTNN